MLFKFSRLTVYPFNQEDPVVFHDLGEAQAAFREYSLSPMEIVVSHVEMSYSVEVSIPLLCAHELQPGCDITVGAIKIWTVVGCFRIAVNEKLRDIESLKPCADEIRLICGMLMWKSVPPKPGRLVPRPSDEPKVP